MPQLEHDYVARLRIGHGPWKLDEGRPGWARPRSSFRTGLIVVGAGVTGSMVAQHLAAAERGVAVIDRLAPSQGSTAASTAMLQWEIDKSLTELTDVYGFAHAAHIYRQSVLAVHGLGKLASALRIDCAWRDRSALYLAADGESGKSVRDEFRTRKAAGLPGDLLEPIQLHDLFGIVRGAGILSSGAAECDPVRLAYGLLSAAVRQGAKLVHDEVVAYDTDARGARVLLASGIEIEGDALVLATGYVMPPFVKTDLSRQSASWAAVTPRGTPLGFWHGRALIWEDATPYLYARTTADDRILVGGEDETVDDAEERDRLAPAKAAVMHAKLQDLFGVSLPAFESVWSAAFSETVDGLPLIGPVPGSRRAFAAYGYGGNGITFSYLASRMIGELVAGRAQSWFESFALDRSAPSF